MKLTKKNAGLFVLLFVLGLITGTLVWEIIERIFAAAGVAMNLGVGPVGFDLDVIAFYIKVNPGSLVGVVGGTLLFFRL